MKQGLHDIHWIPVQMFGGEVDFVLFDRFVFGTPEFHGAAPSIGLALPFGLDGNGRFRKLAFEEVDVEERKAPVQFSFCDLD
jgi:hypothetical protein